GGAGLHDGGDREAGGVGLLRAHDPHLHAVPDAVAVGVGGGLDEDGLADGVGAGEDGPGLAAPHGDPGGALGGGLGGRGGRGRGSGEDERRGGEGGRAGAASREASWHWGSWGCEPGGGLITFTARAARSPYASRTSPGAVRMRPVRAVRMRAGRGPRAGRARAGRVPGGASPAGYARSGRGKASRRAGVVPAAY